MIQKNIYDYWLVKDIAAYFKLAAGKYDRENVVRIINKPVRYVKRAMITQPFSFEALRCSYEDNQNMLERINDMQFDIKMLAKLTPYAAVNYILKGIGYEDYIEEEITGAKYWVSVIYGPYNFVKEEF